MLSKGNKGSKGNLLAWTLSRAGMAGTATLKKVFKGTLAYQASENSVCQSPHAYLRHVSHIHATVVSYREFECW